MATTWLSTEEAIEKWGKVAPPREELDDVVQAAREQCEQFAPVIPEGSELPERYRIAHLLQARAIWNARQTGPGDAIGEDGFTVRVHPMDWQVRQLLRPPAGIPGIG